MGETVKQSEVDLAYQVLKQSHQAMYFRDLINAVLSMKNQGMHVAAQLMAQVHTQINMDSRFVHMGKGMWGLTEWLPQHGAARYAEELAATAEPSNDSQRREKLLAGIQEEVQPNELPGESE